MDRKDEALGCAGIFATLKLEHATVAAVITELAGSTANDDDRQPRRRELFEEIRVELLSHAAAEEVTFYARLKSKPETSAQIDESIDEHQRMEDLLEELERLGTDSLIFDSRFEDLAATVQRHVEEEENDLFPTAAAALTSEEIEDLDDAFKTQKRVQLQGFQSRSAAASELAHSRS